MRVAENSSRHVHYVHVWRYRMRCRITTSCMLSYFTQFAFQMVVNLVSVTCAPEDGCHTIQTSPHQHVRCQVVSRSFQGHGWLSLIHERLPVGLHRAKFHVNRWTMPGSGYLSIFNCKSYIVVSLDGNLGGHWPQTSFPWWHHRLYSRIRLRTIPNLSSKSSENQK